MKRILAFLVLAVAAFGVPVTPINNANIQLNGVSQSGVLAANSTGAANVTAAQFSAAMDLLGSTRGSVLYRGASGWTALTPGTSGFVLTSSGAGADPSWTAEGHTGTVTSFSAGNLSPLFTTNVATATTTPVLTFSLSNATANRVFAGPTTGADAAPTFRALVAADVPAANIGSTGNGGVTGLGTGVATALGVNVGSAGAPVVNGGALGTPSSGVGTNLTILKITSLTGDSLQITYTGTPIVPMTFPQSLSSATFPVATSPGTVTQSAASAAIWNMGYNEGTVLAGGSALAGRSLATLSFDNLVTGGTINIFRTPNLTSLSFPVLTSMTGGFTPSTMPSLTTLSTPSLVFVNATGDYAPANMASLTTLSCPALTYTGKVFNPNTMASLATLSFPVLVTVASDFTPGTMAALTSCSFPDLVTVGGNFAPTTMGSVTTWSFPVLANIGGTFAPTTFGALTSLSCNSLQYVDGAFSITTMANLTTASFSGMIRYGSTITVTTGVSALATYTMGTIGTLKEVAGATVTFSGAALNQASVDGVLNLLASLDGTSGTTSFGTGKTVTLNGGTNASPTTTGTTTTTPAGSSFVGVGTTCTATIVAHGFSTGDYITVTGVTTLTNANTTAQITVTGLNTFTYHIVSQTATGAGTATLRRTAAAGTDGFHACQVLRVRGASVTTALGF